MNKRIAFVKFRILRNLLLFRTRVEVESQKKFPFDDFIEKISLIFVNNKKTETN